MDSRAGVGGRRPSGPSDARRAAAAREAMARMEEVMLAHAGAAGEFSIVLDAPLPSLQHYRRNPSPSASPLRLGAHGGVGRDDAPTRSRRGGGGGARDGVGYGEKEEEAAAVRLVGPTGRERSSGLGGQRARGGALATEGKGEEVEEEETPLRLLARGGSRPSSRRSRPEVKGEEQEEEEETPLRLLARGGSRPSSRRSRPEVKGEEQEEEEETALRPLARGGSRPSSRRSRPEGNGYASPAKAVVAEVEAEAKAESRQLAAAVIGGQSRSGSPAISNVKDGCFCSCLKQIV